MFTFQKDDSLVLEQGIPVGKKLGDLQSKGETIYFCKFCKLKTLRKGAQGFIVRNKPA